MLKVVHLNTYDGNGGAGRGCLRLNKALAAHGIQSSIVVHYKFGQNPQVQSFNGNALQKAITAGLIVLERLLAKRYLKPLKTPFSFAWFGRNVTRHPAVLAADVIHLHWVNHGFLSPRQLAKLAKLNKPIVWTFHDSNAFTGGCHVRYTCTNYQQQCGECPLLQKPSPTDISKQIWQQKQQAYNQLNFEVIAPSSWMKQSIQQSSLMAGRKVHHIPNTLETDIFTPVNQQEAREALGLPTDKLILLSGFMPSRKDLHKGTSYLLESLELLAKREDINPEQIELVIFGNRDDKDLPEFAFGTRFLGTINNDALLAQCYAAADGFLIPSLEDNLPYTVMESLACGTPVIAFTTGGIPDMVSHQQNGYLATYRSVESFADGMQWLLTHPNRQQLRQQARQTVIDKFAEGVIAQQHLEVYQQVSAAQS